MVSRKTSSPDSSMRTLGWFFRGFNRGVRLDDRAVRDDQWPALSRKVAIVMILYVGLLVLTGYGFRITPTGFVPQQDQGYLLVGCQLPDGASLERTQAVTAKALAMIKETPGVKTTLIINGFSILTGTSTSNVASLFVILDEFHERKGPNLTADAIVGESHGESFDHSGGSDPRLRPSSDSGRGQHRRLHLDGSGSARWQFQTTRGGLAKSGRCWRKAT